MKIWIESESKHKDGTPYTFRTTIINNPVAIQLYKNADKDMQLNIWLSGTGEDWFSFRFKDIQGLLFDGPDSNDFIQKRMVDLILTEWKKYE